MGLKADAIVGYTYDAENLCPHCTIDYMVSDQSEIPGKSIEEKLDYIASIGANPRGEVINRHDENSFDSGVFPCYCVDFIAAIRASVLVRWSQFRFTDRNPSSNTVTVFSTTRLTRKRPSFLEGRFHFLTVEFEFPHFYSLSDNYCNEKGPLVRIQYKIHLH